MTRPSGYALLTAMATVIVLVCVAIVVATGGPPEAGTDALAGPQTSAPAVVPASTARWIATWAAAPAAGQPGTPHGFPDLSIRNVVHTSVGGDAARVELSNLFGTAPLILTHVTLGVAAGPHGAGAVPGELVTLTFDGSTTVTIPAGRDRASDPVRLRVPADADLLVTTYTADPSGPATYHPLARQISYVARGDHAGDTAGTAFTGETASWHYVTAVDVWTDQAKGCVVAFGDSITDGAASTLNADDRWPDLLADRLRDDGDGPRLATVDEGISGDKLLLGADSFAPWDGPSALSRLDRDALDRAGVTTLLVDLGINDIQEPPRQLDAVRIIAGLRRITQEANARGVRVIGSTLTPFGGHSSWTPQLEVVREQVNAAIRSGSVFNFYVDFDRVLRDPADPQVLRPAYDSGDHLHPDDAGYRAMADAIPLEVLTGALPAGV